MGLVDLIFALTGGAAIGDGLLSFCEFPRGVDPSWWTSPTLGCFDVAVRTIAWVGSNDKVFSCGDRQFPTCSYTRLILDLLSLG